MGGPQGHEMTESHQKGISCSVINKFCSCCHAGEYYNLSLFQSLPIERDMQGSEHVNGVVGRGRTLPPLVKTKSAPLAGPAVSCEASYT